MASLNRRLILFLLFCLMTPDLRAERPKPGQNKPIPKTSKTPGPQVNPSEPPNKDPLPPPPPPGNPKFRESTKDDDDMALGTEGTLTIDLRKGAPDAKNKNPELERLKAVIFTINSLNRGNRELLNVDDIIERNFGQAGIIPKTGDVKVKINLSGILSKKQNSALRGFLANDPLVCGSTPDARTRELDNGISADTLVRQVYDPENYNSLMVENNRERFDRSLGVVPEFDSPTEGLDQSDKTMRILLAPGDSGVAHKGAQRKIVLQRTNYGGFLIRSEDIEKQNASKVSFAVKPVSAKGNGHEGILQLPNGLFAFELRNRDGAPVTSAPVTLVIPKITNPISCLKCHSNGYIATKGGEANEKGIDDLRKMDITDEGGIGKNLYRATFQDYQKEITKANTRFEEALKKSGVGDFGIYRFYSDLDNASFSVSDLAKEFNVSEDTLVNTLLGDLRFGNALDLRPWKEAREKNTSFPRLSRQELENQVDAGRGGTPSLYCALKERVVSVASRPHKRKETEGEDGLVHDSKDKKGHPQVQPNRDENL